MTIFGSACVWASGASVAAGALVQACIVIAAADGKRDGAEGFHAFLPLSLAICGAADTMSLASIRAEASQAVRACTGFGFGSSFRPNSGRRKPMRRTIS